MWELGTAWHQLSWGEDQGEVQEMTILGARLEKSSGLSWTCSPSFAHTPQLGGAGGRNAAQPPFPPDTSSLCHRGDPHSAATSEPSLGRGSSAAAGGCGQAGGMRGCSGSCCRRGWRLPFGQEQPGFFSSPAQKRKKKNPNQTKPHNKPAAAKQRGGGR